SEGRALRRRPVVSYAFRQTYPKGARVFRGLPVKFGDPGHLKADPGSGRQSALLQQLPEVRDSPHQPIAQGDLRFPSKLLPRLGDVRLADLWVVHWKGKLDNLQRRIGDLQDQLRQLAHSELDRIADVGRFRITVHEQSVQPL